MLTVTQMLRTHGVVGKFVEFYGDGLQHLPLADRATIANMAPEYGATCGIFPIDAEALNYLRLSGRSEEQIALVEAYAKAQGLWHDAGYAACRATASTLELDLGDVQPVARRPEAPAGSRAAGEGAGQLPRQPRWPADRQPQGERRPRSSASTRKAATSRRPNTWRRARAEDPHPRPGLRAHRRLGRHRGDHVVHQHVQPGGDARRGPARAQGRRARPQAQAVGEDRRSARARWSSPTTCSKAGVLADLEKLGFYVVGYGCTTCIGNSGPLPDEVSQGIAENDLVVASVLSGNRNFEGRVHPEVKMNYLASPPLVVAYALAGTVDIDLTTQPLGTDSRTARTSSCATSGRPTRKSAT